MTTRNSVTNDLIKSKPINDNFRNNFDDIFKKKDKSKVEEVKKEKP